MLNILLNFSFFSSWTKFLFAQPKTWHYTRLYLPYIWWHKTKKVFLMWLDLPTTFTGFLYGINPKVYWKIPRPWKSTGANATFLWIFSWISRSRDPLGLLTWLNSSFSPNAKTGTREALQTEQHPSVISTSQTKLWSPLLKALRPNLFDIFECLIMLYNHCKLKYFLTTLVSRSVLNLSSGPLVLD